MPAKRRPLRREIRVTFSAEIIALWRQALHIDAAWQRAGGDDVRQNPIHGRRIAIHAALELSLRLAPWMENPVTCFESDPPSWMTLAQRERWKAGWELRQALNAAAARPRNAAGLERARRMLGAAAAQPVDELAPRDVADQAADRQKRTGEFSSELRADDPGPMPAFLRR